MRTLNSSMEKMYFYATMILFASIFGRSFGQVVLNTAKFYDKYGSEVSIAYGEGHVLIHCICPAGDEIELLRNGEKLKTETCATDGFTFNLNINEMKFGTYKCRHKSVESAGWDYLCTIDECEKAQCTDKDTFCVNEATTKMDCGYPVVSSCSKQHGKSEWMFCAKSDESFCMAVAKQKYSKIWVEQNDDCVEETDAKWFPYVKYPEPVRYGESIDLKNGSGLIRFECPRGDFEESNITCIIKGSDGVQLQLPNFPSTCPGNYKFTDVLKSGPNIFKLECNLTSTKNTNLFGRLSNFLVTSGGKVIINRDDREQFTNSMECGIDSSPPPEFTVECKWKGIKIVDPPQKTGKLDVTEEDDYTCTCTIVYKTCSPHTRFEYQISSESNHAIPDPKRTTRTSIATTSSLSNTSKPGSTGEESVSYSSTPVAAKVDATKSSEDNKMVLAISISVPIVGLLLLGGILAFILVRRKRRMAEEKQRPEGTAQVLPSPKSALQPSPKSKLQPTPEPEPVESPPNILLKLRVRMRSTKFNWRNGQPNVPICSRMRKHGKCSTMN